jgi:hypothetical protein
MIKWFYSRRIVEQCMITSIRTYINAKTIQIRNTEKVPRQYHAQGLFIVLISDGKFKASYRIILYFTVLVYNEFFIYIVVHTVRCATVLNKKIIRRCQLNYIIISLLCIIFRTTSRLYKLKNKDSRCRPVGCPQTQSLRLAQATLWSVPPRLIRSGSIFFNSGVSKDDIVPLPAILEHLFK